mgnify:CR=1 FL=1
MLRQLNQWIDRSIKRNPTCQVQRRQLSHGSWLKPGSGESSAAEGVVGQGEVVTCRQAGGAAGQVVGARHKPDAQGACRGCAGGSQQPAFLAAAADRSQALRCPAQPGPTQSSAAQAPYLAPRPLVRQSAGEIVMTQLQRGGAGSFGCSSTPAGSPSPRARSSPPAGAACPRASLLALPTRCCMVVVSTHACVAVGGLTAMALSRGWVVMRVGARLPVKWFVLRSLQGEVGQRDGD